MGYLDAESLSEGSRVSNGSAEGGDCYGDISTDRAYTNGAHGLHRGPFNGQTKWLAPDLKEGRAARGSCGESGNIDVRCDISSLLP